MEENEEEIKFNNKKKRNPFAVKMGVNNKTMKRSNSLLGELSHDKDFKLG